MRQACPHSVSYVVLPRLTAIVSNSGAAYAYPDRLCWAQVEVQEAYGKQSPQRYPLDPPDPKSVTGEDTSSHNRGMGGPLARLPLSVQPGEVLVQVCITTCVLWLAELRMVCTEDADTGVWHTLLKNVFDMSTIRIAIRRQEIALYWWTDSQGFAGADCR